MKKYRTVSVVARNFRARRESLGMSQEALAKRVYMTRGNISKFELGKRSLPLEMMPLFKEVLQLRVIDELMIPGRFVD